KPVKPEPYGGEQDIKIFHRFMVMITHYVEDLKAQPDRMMIVVSMFLKGKAFAWYTQEIARVQKKMRLAKFFSLLYQWVFPPNYQQLQRNRLEGYTQGGRTVKEYAAGVRDMWDTSGVVSKLEKQQKFWHGLCSELQSALWR
ncbi:hypothetical protein FA15DRAFT_551568, partial [Coprinopsis marcescibilis]